MNRSEMLTQIELTKEWDIIIIGGGATGLGCAVDAASRGYKTLLVEQSDFGKGTSSKSTKLVHGGVRYLAHGNIKLVKEALRERAYLLHNAPGVTSILPFVVPVYNWWHKWFYGIGLKLYDLLAGKLSLGKTQWLNKQQTLQQLQGINSTKLKGGILYFDGQFDDARLAIELAKTAAANGATMLNYCAATSFIKTKETITGIYFYNIINNTSYTTNAKVVINATGVFANAIMQMDEPLKPNVIAPSQGIHLVIDASFFPSKAAMMIPKTDDGRVLFAVPWHNKVLLGTTDTPVANVEIEPKPLQEEINFILQHANRYLSKTITNNDVRSAFAGLRPLIKQKGLRITSSLSRDHTIFSSSSGLITVTGGKWTTYRKMAEDAVSKAADVGGLSLRKCITKTLRISGNSEDRKDYNNNFLQTDVPISNDDISFFVEQEMATTVEDVLARRTRLLFLNAEAARLSARSVALQMAALLHKDDVWIQQQVTSFDELTRQYLLPLS